jgi:hypothetical protein
MTEPTEKEICTKCYDIQDVCNFVPVCLELSTTVLQLKRAGIPHEKINEHPAVIILVDKISDMMHRPDLDKVFAAFTYCREMKRK